MTKTIVLDASAFIAGYSPLPRLGRHFTVPEVQQEIQKDPFQTNIMLMIETGSLQVMAASKEDVRRVSDTASETGDLGNLSAADVSVLALALRLKSISGDVVLVSEDYSVQNTAQRLGIRYQTLSTRGITKAVTWITYCPGCRRAHKHMAVGDRCPVCGTVLKRRPGSKKDLLS